MAEKKKKNSAKKVESYQEIKFLNIPEKTSMASIGVKISGNITGRNSYRDNYEIKISDCNSNILLHGSLKTPESRKNALNKFDTLIEVLTEARNHIERELKTNKLKFN